jgi:uncharacterized repeat protein (TIGR01451 family)
MLVYLRNESRSFDYTLSDSWYDPPSYGPKHALLLVDSHYWPMSWSNYKYASGANLRITSRCQPANAAFTLQDTTPFTLRLGYNPANGQYLDTPLETKTFPAQPAVKQFHDSLGYYPGLWFRPETGGLYFWQVDASMVVPAKGNYTTRITDLKQNPFTPLYGYDLGDTVLGSGNPGDAGVQYGLHLAITSQAEDGSWGQIKSWNGPALEAPTVTANRTSVKVGQTLTYTVKVRNTSPVPQMITITDLIPANTTYVYGSFYDAAKNAIVWNTTVQGGATQNISFTVKVNAGTPIGTMITNTVTVTDDALGSTAALKLKVIK